MYTLTAGQYNNTIENIWTYSTQNKTTYNGVEFTVNARGDKYLLFGGITTDRRASTSCDGDTQTNGNSARDNPNSLRFCDAIPPFRTTVKASAAFTLPYDIQVSGSFASIPAGSISANYTITSAIAGRSIIGSPSGTSSTIVNLVQPNTMFLDTQNRADLRIARTFKYGQRRIQAFVDVFNVLNAGTVTSVNQTYATSGTNLWLTPTGVIEPRYAQFGMQLTF
jgi:hypothetical protein